MADASPWSHSWSVRMRVHPGVGTEQEWALGLSWGTVARWALQNQEAGLRATGVGLGRVGRRGQLALDDRLTVLSSRGP